MSETDQNEPPSRFQQTERALRPAHVTPVAVADLVAVAGSTPITDATVTVTGVCLDSRAVLPGDLYAALPGQHTHGARYAQAAVAAGARAILTDPAGAELLSNTSVPVLIVDDPRAILGAVAATVYDTAAQAPELFAVTGTNGKTTTTYIMRSLLESLGHHTGIVGTIEIAAGDRTLPAAMTTPESPQMHGLIAHMAQANLDSVAIEVTSHALQYHRVAGLQMAVAGFTNLTHDHLDLHGDMEHYYATKARLFTTEYARRGVIIIDDEWGSRLAAEAEIPVVTLLTRPAVAGEDPDYRVEQIERDGVGHAFELWRRDGERFAVRTGLPFLFNVSNVALALTMLLESGVSADAVRELIAREPDALTPFIPGRMQIVHEFPTAIVDFAHNPDALTRVLDSVRTEAGRTILVFGATGDRDREKRPVMGAIAAHGADVVIVTDDDPHLEDPATVRAAVLEGAHAAAVPGVIVREIAPRSAAIAAAARWAGPADVIVVAGRGHETTQDVGADQVELDDREELITAFAEIAAGR